MARFGLLDSDSDSDASTASPGRRSRSASAAPSGTDAGDASFASSAYSDGGSIEDDEDAPPRSSLMQGDDDEDLSGSQGYEDDEDMADDTFLDQQQRRQASGKARRDDRERSMSSFSRASSRSLVSRRDRDSSRTPSPPRLRALPSSLARSSQQQPLPKKLGLDPSRVAVMQASFFQQPGAAGLEPDEEQQNRREREQEERERKRRAVEQGLAGRSAVFSQPPPAAAAPQPVHTPVLDPAPFRSYRQYERVPLASSVIKGKEGNVVDDALGVGRAYRVGWGPNGEIVSLKSVYSPEAGKSDVLQVERVRLTANDDPSSALRLLKLQLQQSEIFPPTASPSSSPAAVPSASLRFSHFVDLFTSSAASPSSASEEAQLFKLASVLFDEIPSLALPSPADDPDLGEETQTASYRNYITALRRKAQLSAWLEEAVAPEVEADLRSLSSSTTSPSASAAARVFAHLSGHQIARAVAAATESGNLRLATLLAQLPSSGAATVDAQFAEDIFLQLSKWREYRADAQIAPEVRRVYEVLCGNLGVSEGRQGGAAEDRTEELHVLEKVGWKRAVGMGVWYALPGASPAEQGDAGVAEAVARYEAALSDSRVARPTPSYLSSGGAKEGEQAWQPSRQEKETPLDPAFHLLKLFTSPVHPLSSALLPRNFGSSPTDYRLPWHLYVLFSRVLRRRDFEDREEVEGEMGEEVEGNSVTADRVTVSYAQQLERMGQWEWAAFVLLHLELEAHRTNALRALLSRHTSELQDEESEKFKFVTETLKIPAVWVWSAQADLSLSSPTSRFKSYTLLLRSLRAHEAHQIAVEELVPEAIVRGDVGLVKRLLEPFTADDEEADGEGARRGTVEGWEEGGQVYLLYLSLLSLSTRSLATTCAVSNLPLLTRAIAAVQGLAQRAQSTPRTRGNKKLRLACEEMGSRLAVLAKAAGSAGGGASLAALQPSLLPESDRAVWIQGANKAFWEASLGKVGVAA
ncbi:hypothetical protein JCM10213_000791 [Rhodosporidiobolus nylandii]